jgi:hypothetical protein
MRPHNLLLSLLLALSSVTEVRATTGALQFNCLNPHMQLSFTSNDVTTKGGQASSQPVQFGINQHPLPQGSINVDTNNNGICTVTINPGHIIKRGWAVFDPLGSSTAGGHPNDINAFVKITAAVTSNQKLVFSIEQPDGSKNGSVTLTFFVEYEDVTK